MKTGSDPSVVSDPSSADVDKTPRRPGWLPTLATLFVIAVCITAGNWQRDRMHQRDALRARYEAAAAAPPVALPADLGDVAEWRFRAVYVTGTFDAAHQILIDNRVRNGRVGYDVVTPLVMTDRRVILVDRGFVPSTASRAQLPSVPPPSGEVNVRGRIAVPPSRYFEVGDVHAQGVLWLHLDPRRFSEGTGINVLPVVVEATAPTGNDADLDRDWPPPDIDSERNLSYMVQWYTFAAMAAFLWFWFTFRRHRKVEPASTP